MDYTNVPADGGSPVRSGRVRGGRRPSIGQESKVGIFFGILTRIEISHILSFARCSMRGLSPLLARRL